MKKPFRLTKRVNPTNRLNPEKNIIEKEGYAKKLVHYSEYILALGVLLYILGFIIENVFLGSFGVVLFDLIKVRYILIGFLFSFFAFAIVYPTVDTIKYYLKNQNLQFYNAIARMFSNGMFLFMALLLLITVLEVLTGPEDTLPLGVTEINPVQPLTLWISNIFPHILMLWLKNALFFGLFTTGLLASIFGFFIVFIHEVDGIRLKRTEYIKIVAKRIKGSKRKIFLDLLVILVILFVFLPLITSLIIFVTSNKIDNALPNGVSLFNLVKPAYFRFVLAIVICYFYISVILLALVYIGKGDKTKSNEKPRSMHLAMGYSYFAVIIFVLLIPIYSCGVYPLIPQQVGGGRPVSVTIIMNENESNYNQISQCSQHLLDRTSTSLLVLCSKINGEDYVVQEIEMDQVRSIIFNRE